MNELCRGCYTYIHLSESVYSREIKCDKYVSFCPCTECIVKSTCQKSCSEFFNFLSRIKYLERNLKNGNTEMKESKNGASLFSR